MRFFSDKTRYTHRGSFYCIPVYLNLDSEDGVPVVEGTNIITDKLFTAMTIVHNTVIEFSAQILSYLLDRPYEPGFCFHIKEELDNEESTKSSDKEY